jgi:hypothetical protein
MSFPAAILLASIDSYGPANHVASGAVSGNGDASYTYSDALEDLGAMAGDFAVVIGGAPTSGGAWTTVTGGPVTLYVRELSAADLVSSGKIRVQTNSWAYTIHRGPKALAFKAAGGAGGGATANITGFAKNIAHSGLLTVSAHYIPGSGGTPGLPTSPATWTSRVTFGNTAGDTEYRIADRLMPANTAYVDSETIVWTTYFGSVPGEGSDLAVYEFRTP